MNPDMMTSKKTATRSNGTLADLKKLYTIKTDEKLQKIYDKFYAFCIDNINRHENKSYIMIAKPGTSEDGLCYRNLTMRIDDDDPATMHKQLETYFRDNGMSGTTCIHRSNKIGHPWVPTFYTIFFSFD